MFTDKWMTCIVIYLMYTSQLCRIGAYEYPTPCDFDHSLCQWQQLDDDYFDWTLQSGNTPSGSTGPSSDHTQGSGGSGQYLYIEASSNYEKTARLVSSPINPSLSDPCTMVFYYHMYGTDIGNLQILFRYEGETNENSVWYKTGNQGNSWNRGSVSFYNVTRPFQVIVQGVTGDGYKSDIAIDDISFLDGCIRGDEGGLRLVNPVSGSQKEGRVEIFLQGQWGSICSFGTSWNLEKEGKVVCRQLGYQSAEWTRSIYPAPDTTPILLDNVQCNGTEAALVDCSHDGYGVVDSRCTHLYDITLQCLEGCVDPGTPTNGRQTGSPDFSHGSDVTFVCSSGYEIEGSSSISCNDGTWSAHIPICSVVGSTHDQFGTSAKPMVGTTHYPMGTSARPMIRTTHDPFGTSARPMVGSTHDQFGTSAQPMVETTHDQIGTSARPMLGTTHDPIGTSARPMLGTTPDFMWTSNPPEAGTSHDSIATSTQPIDMTTNDPIRVMTQPMPETTHDSNGTPTAPMIVSTQDQNVVRSPTPSETRNTEALHETTTQPVEESTKQSMRVMTSPIVGTTKNLIASTDSVSTRDERYVYTTPGRYDTTTAVYDQPGSSRLRLSTEQTTRLPERVTTSESVRTDTTHIPEFAYSINLRIVNSTSRSATIAWQDQFQNGRQVETLDYQVRYTADGETQMLYSLSSHSTVILMDLRPGTQYMVSVTGNTVIGSNTSNEVQFVTDPEPPLWIDVIDFDSDSIQLWFQVGWSKYDFFRVSIQKKTGGDYVEIDATSPKVTLEQLVPETLYEISVKTVVNIGGNTFESSRSKTVVNSTAPDYCASDPCPGSTTCISSSAGYFCNCPSGDAEQCWQKSDGKQENSVPMSFTLENAEYSEELADRTSSKFKQLEKDIIGEISQLYANNSDFERVEITEFRPGSIVVVMNIVLHDNATESAIESAVESATSHLSMNGILNYTTSNVTRQKDYCYGKPCQNDGICVSGSADYVCYCRDNYIGKRCEHEYIVLDRGSQTMWFLEEEKVINPIMEIRSLVRNPESVLEYGLKNTADSVFFKLDTKTGQLNTTLGSFDRESRENYQLGITLTGRASRSVLDITIHVEDINDNNPVFHNTPYYPKVMEYSPVGTLITTLTAVDPDQNDDLNYSLSSDQSSLKYFSNLVSVESKTGRVILTGTLNRKLLKEDGYLVENENVAIPIAVSDGATSTRGTIFLDVVPLFVRPTVTSNETTRLRLSLPEDAAVGSFVADVRLPESDDVEYTYRIFKADNYNNFSFAVNETSGVVRTTQTLDREERDDYGFYVFALDNHCLTSTEVYIELRVEDVNDNAPEFPETSYSAEIREDATSAQTVFIQPPIRATDKDIGTNAEIAFSLSGQGHEQFTIDPETGTVKTSENNNLDYETTKMYSLTLTARDMNGDAGGQWNSVPLIIYITDYNDNKPLFSHPNVSLQLSEATQPGSSITSINATDADEGLNAALLYFISEGSQGKFKVDLHTGELSVLGHLDRETTEFYDLEIIVRDQGLHVLDNAVHVLINVTDVNDNSPMFTELFYSAHVVENATLAFQVISVTASDADTGDNGRVTYALDSTQEFVIDPMTGIVTTRLQLDRENVDSYNLVVTATDNGDVRLSSTATVRIVIDDVNDNIPKFSKTEYTSTLLVRSSKLRNGTIATIVSASDPDSGENGKVAFSVDDAEHSQTFSIDSSGVVRVNRDKLTNSELITFNITARNDVSPAQFDRAIVVIVLEHPLKTLAFDVEDYEFRVTENVIADLGTVRVLNSSGITYKLPFDIPGIHINSTSGVITLTSPLDREINPQVIFNVFAESEYIAEGLAFTTVTITVEDVNDNPPYFEYPDELYHVVAGGLGENHLNDTFFTVQANDEDSGHNGQIQYSIIDGNEDAKFNIDSDTGVISVISEVDREMVDHYILTIMAQDMGEDDRLNSTTQIFIPIVDENDNAPNITIDSSNVVVQENVLIGTEVAFVRAADDDSGQNAEIEFELIGDADGYFQIDALSGSIRTKKDMDYETKEKYDIAVIAVDKGLPSSRTSETLRIEVLVSDYNDNSPHFTGQPYAVSLAKDSDPGSSVLQVTATDDDSGRNADLTYTIIGTDKCGLDLFNIDETTGVLKHTRVLYEEPAGTCLLTVRVMDDGQERLSDIAIVEVNITEVNHPPQFESDIYSATVPENEPVGSDVNTSPNPPKAIDDDHGPNAEVVYRILGGNEDGFFSIDSATGLIKVASSLDREIVDSVHMLLVAHDRTVDPKSATANLTITIDDVNDNAPELPPQGTAVISQDSMPGSFVTTINATDADLGPNTECSFSFLGEAKLDRVKVEQPNDLFVIDDFSGNITTKNALYRIVGASTVSIELLVIAENRQPLVATSSQNWRGLAVTWLTILFTFDYTPVCGQDVYQVSIPEDTSPGTLLNISLEENSNSLKPIPALTYAITSGNDRNSFGIIGDSVVDIKVQNVLDVRTYNLTISVSTPDPLHGKGTCFVVVEVFQVVTAPPSSTTLPSGRDNDLSSVALVAIIALSAVSTLLFLLVILVATIYRGKNASLSASLKASGLMPTKPKKSKKLGFYEWLVMRAATKNKKGAKYKDQDGGKTSEMTERYVHRPWYAGNRNTDGELTAESDYLDVGDVEGAYEQIPAEQDMVYTEPDNYLTMASVETSTQTNPFGISESEIGSPSRDFSA